MDLLANDLSFHEQFQDLESFRDALSRLVSMRNATRRFGREVYCHHALLTTSPMPGVQMQRAIGQLGDRNQQRAAMSWMTYTSRLWEDLRQHGPDDWLECRGDIVTDTAVGEAAFRTLHDVECGLVSVTPSDWDCSPVEVIWRRKAAGSDDKAAILENWRDAISLEEGLRDAAPPIRSWDDLHEASTNRFESLIIAGNCFKPLDGVPFAKSSADRILVLLGILDKLAQAFNADGARTPEGQQIYQDHFMGDGASFSDSSNTEKNKFRKELTFRHPTDPEKDLFCTWHGKVRHMTLRLHYWWSGKADDPVFIVYAGPKITQQ